MANVLPEQVLRAYLLQIEAGAGGAAPMGALRDACQNLKLLMPSFREADLARSLIWVLMERSLEDLTRAVPWNEELDQVREQVLKLGQEALERFVELHDPDADHLVLLLELHESMKRYDSLVEELNDTDRQALRNQIRSE
ncbi:MAG: hypothetical protein H6963_01345 [Chromatiaceae bacterium]|nr:hypothetical protein [Gammaproteobacteria bacterium]MCP5407925.1 hypothetical protein [Chromatiaceae bacterium]